MDLIVMILIVFVLVTMYVFGAEARDADKPDMRSTADKLVVGDKKPDTKQ